jgi:AcrR family transcriptional regulator
MNIISKVVAKRQEGLQRKKQIISAAKTLFFKNGYIGATMRDIALEAELSPGLIYHYFKNKDAIYCKICEEAFYLLIHTLEKADVREKPVRMRFELLARAYIDFYMKYPEYFEIISFNELGYKKIGLNNEVLEQLNRLSLHSLSLLNNVVTEAITEGIIEKNGNPWEITLSLWASIEGIIFIHKRGYLETFNLDIEEILNRQIALLGNIIRE